MTDTTVLDDHVDADAGTGAAARTRTRTSRRTHPTLIVLRELAIVCAATLIPLIVVLRLWEGSLHDPFTYFGDSNFYGGVAQNIIEKGWYQHTNRLGAPLGQQLYDFPLEGDNFWYLVMRFLALFTSDWVLLVNLFFIFGFFASAVSACFSLRWLGARRVTATVAAVLFAFRAVPLRPRRLTSRVRKLRGRADRRRPCGSRRRGEHPFSGVPALPGRAGWRWSGGSFLSPSSGRATCITPAFSTLMILTAALVTAAARWTWRPLFAGAVTVVLVAGVVGFNLLPSLLYSHRHGENTEVAHRQPAEVDMYGLRVIQLLTPVPGHRVEPLATLSTKLQQGPFNSEQAMFLGLVGSIGLLGMLGALLVRAVRRADHRGSVTTTTSTRTCGPSSACSRS